MRRFIVGTAILIFSAACGEPTGVTGEAVQASVTEAGVRVINPGEEPIYYFAVDASVAARISWVPCTDPEECPRIEPGSVRIIPFEEVGFWDETSVNAIVYWWHLGPRFRGGFGPDSIRGVLAEP